MCPDALLEFSIFSGIAHVTPPPFLENVMTAIGEAISPLSSDELYIHCDGNVISYQTAPSFER